MNLMILKTPMKRGHSYREIWWRTAWTYNSWEIWNCERRQKNLITPCKTQSILRQIKTSGAMRSAYWHPTQTIEKPQHGFRKQRETNFYLQLGVGFVRVALGVRHAAYALSAVCHGHTDSIHTQQNVVFILIAVLLLALPHSVSARSTLVMVTAVCLTWLMTRSEVANAWWSTAAVLAIATKQAAGTTGRALWQEQLMKLTNIGASIGLIVAWTLLIAGFARKPVSQN